MVMFGLSFRFINSYSVLESCLVFFYLGFNICIYEIGVVHTLLGF